MKRIPGYSTAFLVLLALSTLSFVTLARQRSMNAGNFSGVRPKVTIVFRGLMVFHPDPTRQYFEAGVLPAPEHEFKIQVRENSPNGVSTFSVPVKQFSGFENDVWSFEYASSDKRGISFYQNGPFDRTRGVGDERDFRWAVDLEGKEFYNQLLTTKANQLGPVLRVTSGEFYTKSKTGPLMRNQGDGTFQYFGVAANEIAADAFIESGDMVLRSKKSGREILRLKEKPGTTYEIVVENEPIPHDAHQAARFAHFQYYYRLITKPKAEWYEFKLAGAADSSATSSVGGATFSLANYLRPMLPGTPRIPCMPAGVGKRKQYLH